ncbi:hypothetical protein GCM10010123_41840 [Pilimelia anulata]|uniref:Uncharacterized protein n=1 Tax=Pilimelia anulata TaxID=53371 RepID=A0A8J3BDU8_9ACTN|nr:hypothetical protein GCM10010123_41840 [Pilimelia anulata]
MKQVSRCRSDHVVDLPLEPMIGTIGVAPAAGESRLTIVPDRHGGNLDTPHVRAGNTLYLPVNVEGALLALGDGHARRGEGECCGVAVETAMTTVLIVDQPLTEVRRAVATPSAGSPTGTPARRWPACRSSARRPGPPSATPPPPSTPDRRRRRIGRIGGAAGPTHTPRVGASRTPAGVPAGRPPKRSR